MGTRSWLGTSRLGLGNRIDEYMELAWNEASIALEFHNPKLTLTLNTMGQIKATIKDPEHA